MKRYIDPQSPPSPGIRALKAVRRTGSYSVVIPPEIVEFMGWDAIQPTGKTGIYLKVAVGQDGQSVVLSRLAPAAEGEDA